MDRYLRMRRARYSRRADAFGAAQVEMLRKLANRGVHVSTRKKPVEERLSGYDQNYLHTTGRPAENPASTSAWSALVIRLVERKDCPHTEDEGLVLRFSSGSPPCPIIQRYEQFTKAFTIIRSGFVIWINACGSRSRRGAGRW